MTAEEAFIEIAKRNISLTGWGGFGIWIASCEVGEDYFGRPTKVELALANSPLRAIERLIESLEEAEF